MSSKPEVYWYIAIPNNVIDIIVKCWKTKGFSHIACLKKTKKPSWVLNHQTSSIDVISLNSPKSGSHSKGFET